jgi:tape measure domain-containing protein
LNEAEIARLVTRLIGDPSSYLSALKQAESATQSFASAASTILAEVGLSFTAIGAAIAGVKFAAQFESARVDLEVLLGSAEKGKQVFQDLQAFATRTPFKMTDLLPATRMLAQAGAQAQDLVPLLEMMGNATGGSAEKMNQMALAMEHMIMQGRATGYTLRMMTYAGFNPLKDMAALTGRSMTQLRADMEQGRVGADLVLAAFQRASAAGGTLAGRLEKQSQTLGGLFSTMVDNVQIALAELGNVLVEGLDLKGLTNQIIDWTRAIVGFLKGLSPEAKKTIAEFLAWGAAIGAVTLAFTVLSPVIGVVTGAVTALFGVLWALGSTVIGPTTLILAALLATLVAIGAALLDNADVMSTIGSGFRSFVAFFQPAWKGIKDALAAKDIGLAWDIAWVQIKLTFYTSVDAIASFWHKVTSGLAMAMENASYWIKKIWIETKAELWLSDKEYRDQSEQLERDHASNMGQLRHQEVTDAGRKLKGLYAERAALTAKAAQEAAAAGKEQVQKEVPWLDPSKYRQPIPIHLKPVVHWEAAAYGTAEAVSRIETQFSQLAPAAVGGGAQSREMLEYQQQQVDLLRRMAQAMEILVGKPLALVQPANLGGV